MLPQRNRKKNGVPRTPFYFAAKYSLRLLFDCFALRFLNCFFIVDALLEKSFVLAKSTYCHTCD